MPPTPTTRVPLTALLLLLIGSAGMAAAWTLYAYARDQQASWIAVIAAIDAIVLLRLGRMPAGWPRALCAVLGTILAIALANWMIAAAQVGRSVGLLPWESLQRLGADYAWTLVTLANPPQQLAWLLAALVVAAVAGR